MVMFDENGDALDNMDEIDSKRTYLEYGSEVFGRIGHREVGHLDNAAIKFAQDTEH